MNRSMNQTHRTRSRAGSLALIVIFLLGVLLAATGGLVVAGIRADRQLRSQVASGTAALEKDRYDVAIAAFSQALSTEGTALRVFQRLQPHLGQQPQSIDDVRVALVSTYLVKAYEVMLNLKPAPDLLASAGVVLNTVIGNEFAELKQTLLTARDVSSLCALVQKKHYRQMMKDLLAAEKRALPNDQDFFIMEVRLLIACGKALREPIILEKARELLFFLSYELRIKGPRIDLLWRLLHQ